MLDHLLPLCLPFLRRHKLGPTDSGIHWPDERVTAKDCHRINQPMNVVEARLLLRGRTSQVATRTESAAECPRDQTRAIELRLQVRGINVRRVLNGNLHRIESPGSERLEPFRAFVIKR